MTFLPDTNVILRYLLNDNPAQYREARDLFEKVRSGEARALILESVFVECVYVLQKFYKIPREEISANLSALLRYRGIANSDKTFLLQAVRVYAESGLDIVDCVLYAKAKKPDHTLFTFDEKLKKRK